MSEAPTHLNGNPLVELTASEWNAFAQAESRRLLLALLAVAQEESGED